LKSNWQHATCLLNIEIYKNQNMQCQWVQHNDIIGFQTPFQYDPRNLLQPPQSHQETHFFTILDNDHPSQRQPF